MALCPVCYREHIAGTHQRRSNYGDHATDTPTDPSAVCHTCRPTTMTIEGTLYCAGHGIAAEKLVAAIRLEKAGACDCGACS